MMGGKADPHVPPPPTLYFNPSSSSSQNSRALKRRRPSTSAGSFGPFLRDLSKHDVLFYIKDHYLCLKSGLV